MSPQSSNSRVRLYVMGLSYSQLQNGAFALILAQTDGPYRIPVVVGANEAQSIAIRLENIIPPRPMTHDLFVSFAHAFGVKLKEVFIYKFEDGIFSSELTFTDGDRQVVIDSRTSDAIAIAMRTKSPIYTTREILDETGFLLEETDPTGTEDNMSSKEQNVADDVSLNVEEPRVEQLAEEELQRMLEKLIAEEKYEEAARVSEILKRKRNRNE